MTKILVDREVLEQVLNAVDCGAVFSHEGQLRRDKALANIRLLLDAPSETTTAQLVRSDIEIHLAHCFQAPYETSCKYDDADCPATPKETQ